MKSFRPTTSFVGKTTAALAVLVLAAPVQAAFAAWTAGWSNTSGTFAMASLNHSFTLLQAGGNTGAAAGTGGATMQTNSAGFGSSVYVNLTSSSTVSAVSSGVITPTLSFGVNLIPTYTMYECSVAWNRGNATCPGTMTQPLAPTDTDKAANVTWGTFAVGQTRYYRIGVASGLGSFTLNATSTEAPTRAGIDRTAG